MLAAGVRVICHQDHRQATSQFTPLYILWKDQGAAMLSIRLMHLCQIAIGNNAYDHQKLGQALTVKSDYGKKQIEKRGLPSGWSSSQWAAWQLLRVDLPHHSSVSNTQPLVQLKTPTPPGSRSSDSQAPWIPGTPHNIIELERTS